MTLDACAILVARQVLSPFRYDPPDLQPREVEVVITRCGICHSDIHLIDNDWRFSSYRLFRDARSSGRSGKNRKRCHMVPRV